MGDGSSWAETCIWVANQSLALKAQGAGKDCCHKKAATLLPSFTLTPTATESTASPTSGHRLTTTSPGNFTVYPTSNSSATSSGHTTATHNPATTTTTSHGNATVYPTTNSTATSPRFSTSGPHPGPPPPSPSPSPSSKGALGNYTWANHSQPCVQLQAQIQIRILYPTQGGGEVKLRQWGFKRGQEASLWVVQKEEEQMGGINCMDYPLISDLRFFHTCRPGASLY